MTSRADDIHKLITDIDNLLASSGNRLSQLLSGQSQENKAVLQRIRDFLLGLYESELSSPDIQLAPSTQPLSSLLVKFAHEQSSPDPQPKQSDSAPAEVNSQLSALLQPLRVELSDLLQQRASLVEEVRQLEQRRVQSYSLTQQLVNQEQIISEFLQVLMSRLLPNLSPHLTNSSAIADPGAENTAPTSGTPSFLGSSEQLERLVMLARELDQRLLSLDGTVNLVFEALQRNIKTYHQSLSQGLARMHSQGLQGEELMAKFLNDLTHYLQQQSFAVSSSGMETKNITLASSLAERAPQSLEPPTAMEDSSSVESLDAILLQLTSDQPSLLSDNADANTNELHLDHSPVVTLAKTDSPSDEVDQLYASLFGQKDAVNPPDLVIPEVAVKPDLFTPETITPSLQSPELEKDDLVALSVWEADPEINHHLESTISTPDVLPGNADFVPLSWEELFLVEDTQPPLEVVTPDVDPLPSSDDTISVLTDLVIDVSSDERSLEIPFLGDTLETTPTTVPPVSLLTETVEKEEDILLDSYIPASPQEDLLSLQNHESPTVPEIVLDPVQIQQLHLDLANFDYQATSALPDATNSHDSEKVVPFSPTKITENVPTMTSLDADIPPSPALDKPRENEPVVAVHGSDMTQSPVVIDLRKIIEKKKQATIPTPEKTLSANANLPKEPEHNSVTMTDVTSSVWYLGIDLGTTGISAALLNRSTSVVYPIYWSTENQSTPTPFPRSFRLPAEVYLPMASVPQSGSEIGENAEITPPSIIQDHISAPLGTSSEPTHNLYSAELKPYLQVAVPYKNQKQKWEPTLQLNEFSAGPLIWVVRSLSKLLLTLKSDQVTTTPALIAHGVGLDSATFSVIINSISGVICNCPSNWSEQYRFNLREAILISQLVKHPQQIFFVEEAIAALLPEISPANSQLIQLSDDQGLRPLKSSENPLVGNTLAINIGANSTEIALVDLLSTGEQPTHKDFMLHSFAYAGKGIEQDIICQLLLPPKSRQSRLEAQTDNSGTTSNSWHWQPTIPGLDQMYLSTLELETLELPRVGEPDIAIRIRLQQRLESSLLGHALLDAALALKIILQHQESFTLELADQRWVLQRRDLESQVFVPFVRRLNRELNKLLVARGIPTEAINQAVLTGGLASVSTINRWLRQKLPNAKIMQDAYLDENGAPTCSRVAYGLAILPLHSQILEVSKQQYTDYFLFSELLKILPDRSLSFGEVLQLFENRGVNTRTCQQRLLAFLEGGLPSGLIPSSLDTAWLTDNSRENPDYKGMSNTALFEKLGNLTYRPNLPQLQSLRSYINGIKTSALQSLEEPYTVNLEIEASVYT